MPASDALDRFLALELPSDRIALDPAPDRDGARLLVVDRDAGTVAHHQVRELPDFVRTGDLWLANASAVAPVLTWLTRPSGGRVELLWLEEIGTARWRVFGQTRKLKPGTVLTGDGGLEATVSDRDGEFAELTLYSVPPRGMATWFAAHGSMPLPPYIRKARARLGRDAVDAADRERYQTMFARAAGSIAAPTAGLHFTPALVARMQAAGAHFAQVLLHVGPGTFTHVEPGQAHAVAVAAERAEIPSDTVAAVRAARAAGGRVVAIGSTSLRTLEGLWPGAEAGAGGSAADSASVAGAVDITLRPGRPPRVADALLTNFHLPHTSLRLMVAAVAGVELAHAAYAAAVERDYRFYSYGDAMLIV